MIIGLLTTQLLWLGTRQELNKTLYHTSSFLSTHASVSQHDESLSFKILTFHVPSMSWIWFHRKQERLMEDDCLKGLIYRCRNCYTVYYTIYWNFLSVNIKRSRKLVLFATFHQIAIENQNGPNLSEIESICTVVNKSFCDLKHNTSIYYSLILLVSSFLCIIDSAVSDVFCWKNSHDFLSFICRLHHLLTIINTINFKYSE